MKRLLFLPLVAALSFAFVGCKGESQDSTSPSAENAGTTQVSLYCGQCGFEKGTAECCKGENCENCAFHKDSPLCCKGVEVSGKDVCTKCGNVADDGHQCATDGETCASCELQKGSALCCKLTKDDATADAEGT